MYVIGYEAATPGSALHPVGFQLEGEPPTAPPGVKLIPLKDAKKN